MAKTTFFRVAVEGPTIDGRNIGRDQIQQMADSYNPATYTARINCEHLRGYSPDKPFNAWGSVVAVKAEEVDLELGGKTEKKLALFAQLDVTDDAKAYNQAGQKLFSSIEIQPNFANTNKAYLAGLAVTDSPASLGTQLLTFSRDDKRKDFLFATEEIALAFEDEPAPADIATGAFAAMKSFFERFAKAGEPAPVVPPVATPAPAAGADLATFASALGEQLETFAQGLNASFAKSFAAIDARVAKLGADQDELKATIEKTPPQGYTARPQSAGGAGRVRADF